MKEILTFLGILTLLVSACKTVHSSKSVATRDLKPIEYKEFLVGMHSGIDTSDVRIARNAESFKTLWSQTYSFMEPMPEMPEIDFGQTLVIACFRGVCNKGGNAILVNSLTQKGKTCTLDMDYVSPGENCITAMVICRPFVMITAPKQVEIGSVDVHKRTALCK